MLDFDVTILYVQSSNFLFSVFDREKDGFLLSPKWILNLLFTNHSHILEKFSVILLLFAPDVYVEITNIIQNMYHLLREIDNNLLQFVAHCLYTSEITKVQKWILVEHRKSAEVENLSWAFTWSFLLDRYDLYQLITSCENPNNGIFRSHILWSVVTNAFWRSIKITAVRRPESKPLDILFV